MQRLRIAVLVSGSGTNLQSIIDAVSGGKLDLEIACVVSNRRKAHGLKRAENAHIPAYYIGKGSHPDEDKRATALLDLLINERVDLVVLAGYLAILPKCIIERYKRRIVNIHPSLIPRHCGAGFYGLKVHESVIASGDKISGATVHFVDEGVDTGEVIAQMTVPVDEEDTAITLSEKVLSVEHQLLKQTLNEIACGRIKIGHSVEAI